MSSDKRSKGDKSRKRSPFRHAQDNILARICRPKVLAATSRELLVLEFAIDRTVTHGIRLHGSKFTGYYELMDRALSELVNRRELEWHSDDDGVVLALPNEWPPEALRPYSMTVEDLDPGFDWASLRDTRCRCDAAWNELTNAH